MTTELDTPKKEEKNLQVNVKNSSDAVYGLGMIGAWIYFVGRAVTPQDKVIAVLKGFVWPVFLVLEVFKFLEKNKPAE
jgi:hypothetical protein